MTDLTEKKNPPAPEAEETPGLSLEERVGKLEEEKKRLEEENRSLFDQLLRRQADFDNLRKRLERERMEFRQAGQAHLVEELLPVLDAFERALATRVSGGDEDYRKGVELIYKQLADTLAALGLEPVEAAGQPFDPNLHHAVDRVETTQHPDQEVLATLQKGYRLRQRLLRPAMVRVAVRPPAEPERDN